MLTMNRKSVEIIAFTRSYVIDRLTFCRTVLDLWGNANGSDEDKIIRITAYSDKLSRAEVRQEINRLQKILDALQKFKEKKLDELSLQFLQTLDITINVEKLYVFYCENFKEEEIFIPLISYDHNLVLHL